MTCFWTALMLISMPHRLRVYESEDARLLQELSDAKAEHAELLSVADEDLKATTVERDEARAEIHALRARLGEMTTAVRLREQQPDVPIPDSFDDLPAWAALYLADDVELLPGAFNAAKKSVFDDPALAYQALLLMRTAYVPMRRDGSPMRRDGSPMRRDGSPMRRDSSLVLRERWETGLRQLGLECAPTGGRAGEFPSDYFVNYLGRKTEIDMHLRGSNSRDPRYCFRVYFFWSTENKRAVVAWLPSHLESRIT
jgi:hypothetical protein